MTIQVLFDERRKKKIMKKVRIQRSLKIEPTHTHSSMIILTAVVIRINLLLFRMDLFSVFPHVLSDTSCDKVGVHWACPRVQIRRAVYVQVTYLFSWICMASQRGNILIWSSQLHSSDWKPTYLLLKASVYERQQSGELFLKGEELNSLGTNWRAAHIR